MTQDSDGGGKGSLWGSRRAPLSSSLTSPATPPSPTHAALMAEPAAGSRVYQAFQAHERATRLHIRCARGPSRCPAYPYLLDIIYDHQFAESFTLIFTFMAVEVRGKHLDAIVHAIEFGSCSRITEFHAKLFDAPAPGDPIIESIEVTAAEYAAEIADRGKERAAR